MATFRGLIIMFAFAHSNAMAVFVIRTTVSAREEWNHFENALNLTKKIIILLLQAIRNSGRALSTFLWMCWVGMTATWFTWALQMTITQSPILTPYSFTCQRIENIPVWTWELNLCMGLFDLLVLLLTLQTHFKNVREGLIPFWKQSHQNDVSSRFYWDTVLFFAFSFSVSLISVGWIAGHPLEHFYSAMFTPV
jgi:hypothetical protein